MVIAVSDESGRLLAAFRMPDSTIFSFDVATTKARNAYYFSTREGYDVLRSYVDNNPSTTTVDARAAGRTRLGDHEPDLELRRPAAVPAGDRSREAADAGSMVRSVRLRPREPVHRRARSEPRRQPQISQPDRHRLVPRQRAALQGRPAGRRTRRQRRRRRAGRLRHGWRRGRLRAAAPSSAWTAASSGPAKGTTCGCRFSKFPRNPERR